VTILPTSSELLKFAEEYLNERTTSLKKDVLGCVRHTFPFPGLLYCFSTIDLLGALYGGDATGNTKLYGWKAGTTVKARDFMVKVMHYSSYEAGLLQQIFRHRMVHLAQPKTVIFDKINNRQIAWRMINTNSKNHLKFKKFSKPKSIITLTPYKMTCDCGLLISLTKLMNDIINSVYRKPDGYLESLRTNENLQSKFRTAIDQIYDPNI
jgi:hypothetical protein